MIFITLLQIITSSSAGLCPFAQQPTERIGQKLSGHVITTYSYVGQKEVCIEACAAHHCGKSVNFYNKSKECEINIGNHVSNHENMTLAMDSVYVDCPQRSSCITG